MQGALFGGLLNNTPGAPGEEKQKPIGFNLGAL